MVFSYKRFALLHDTYSLIIIVYCFNILASSSEEEICSGRTSESGSDICSVSTPESENLTCDESDTNIAPSFRSVRTPVLQRTLCSYDLSEESNSSATSVDSSDSEGFESTVQRQRQRPKRRRIGNRENWYPSGDAVENQNENGESEQTDHTICHREQPEESENISFADSSNEMTNACFSQISSPCHDEEESICESLSQQSDASSSTTPTISDTEERDCQESKSLPICPGSTKTRASFEATFLAMSKKHKFSKSTRQDILKFLNMIVPEPNIPSSNHVFEKDIWETTEMTYVKHELCPHCNELLNLETRKCQNERCSNFNEIPNDEVTEMFFIIPVVTQLKRILAENWQLIVQHKAEHNHDDGKLRDICCGKLYQNLDRCNDAKSLVSFVFHIDGAPTVKSKTLSMWPMQCFVVELPRSVRYSFKNIVFSGLWFGTKKPLLQLFQGHFVDQVEELQKNGIEFQVRENEEIIKMPCLKVLGHLADLVAKAPSLNMKQYNGEFGCSICLHPGERISKGRGNVRVYPVYNDLPQRRNHQDTLCHANAAEQSGTPFFGVFGVSPLHRVLHIPDNVLMDYMHLVLEGEFLRRLMIWLDRRAENGYLAKQTSSLEREMLAISFPHDFNRKLRPLTELKRWKDREIQNFFLHASLPLLKLLLPPEYYHHLSLLVSAIWLLIGDEVTTDDTNLARMLLIHYGRMVDTLYGASEVTYTVHALQHLPDQVLNFGPLILHSGFVICSIFVQL